MEFSVRMAFTLSRLPILDVKGQNVAAETAVADILWLTLPDGLQLYTFQGASSGKAEPEDRRGVTARFE